MNDQVQKILNLISDNHRFLITSHRDPDGDSIGSQLALAYLLEKLQKTCRIVNQGELPQRYAFLDSRGKIESFEQSGNSSDIDWDADIVFVLDCTSKNRIGELAQAISQQALIVNIDHHPDNEQFGALNYVDPDASAVGEMVYSLIKSSGISMKPDVATQLYAAILTDTGRFKFGNTTPTCLRTCAALLEEGADPRCITNQIYFNHSLAFLKLLGSILSNLEISEDNRICSMTLRWETLVNLGVDPKELEGLVNYSLFLKGVEVGLLFTEKEDGKTKVNLRSQNEFDVASVARYFGGGGHRNAAGCTVSYPLDETKKIVMEQIKKILRHEPVGSFDS